MSPFLIACEMGNLAIVKLLAETGKVQTDRHPYGLPPLGYASKNGHLPTVLYLLREMQRGPVTREILAATILNGHKSVAEALLPAIASSSQDSSLDRPYDSGFPPDRVKLGPDRFVIFNQHISRLLDVDFIPMPGISGVKSITFSHCGRYIALARPHGIEIYDIIKMERTANSKHDGIRGHKDIMSFSPDGKYLVAVTAAQFSSVSIWDMTDKTHHRTFEITHGSVRSIHFRKDGRIFLIIVMDSSIELWDVENGFAEITFSLDVSVNKASISSNGKYLGAESRDGTVCIWNISTREVLKRFERSNPYDRYTASPITFSPKDENTFCYSTTEGPQLGKVEGGPCTQCTSKCKNPNGKANVFAFTSDSNLLIFDKKRNITEFLDTQSGLSHFILQGKGKSLFGTRIGIASSPTQRLFAIYDNDEVSLCSYRYLGT
ncbi:WD40-repeat-containing domain protein [Daldinia loculata]|uniref:WD40-repeat-containing domain protein n=1 Tax=Daldinia loculata TaxID=103429 RepID=UPI0020C349AE|nr:WD40-repeat-containing domain protein [Daldinia loculata]KAI1643764.1 WD40-repeat-containing domain protein [Daldinia loculata]